MRERQLRQALEASDIARHLGQSARSRAQSRECRQPEEGLGEESEGGVFGNAEVCDGCERQQKGVGWEGIRSEEVTRESEGVEGGEGRREPDGDVGDEVCVQREVLEGSEVLDREWDFGEAVLGEREPREGRSE